MKKRFVTAALILAASTAQGGEINLGDTVEAVRDATPEITWKTGPAGDLNYAAERVGRVSLVFTDGALSWVEGHVPLGSDWLTVGGRNIGDPIEPGNDVKVIAPEVYEVDRPGYTAIQDGASGWITFRIAVEEED